MENKIQSIYRKLKATAVFRSVLDGDVFRTFAVYCNRKNMDVAERIDAYAEFVQSIYNDRGVLSDLVKRLVFEDENVYIKSFASKSTVNANIVASAKKELETFAAFGALSGSDFALDMGVQLSDIPLFDSKREDLYSLFMERMASIDKYGYGIFSSHSMFRLSDDKKIEPIISADKTSMDTFVGYELERGKVVENTEAFLEGRPAANTLLCGDAGTGKSSTVKAIVNAYYSKGLRLIELRKDQLSFLPEIMGRISENPLKFIIFIDDLSFNKSDDNFSMLKAALEGSASARADNALIYATSNRRHIVRENFEDRDGSEVHRNDAMQEKLSLSERFGLVVYFGKPNKQLYLEIVSELAKRAGIELDSETLAIRAEEFALRRGNRSARCAEQFIKSLT